MINPRLIAIDWSGRSGADQRRALWLAEIAGGELVRLEGGRTRDECIEVLIAEADREPNLIIGFDFAFSLPSWYRGSVGPGVVRDFRGAMAGRGDKGLVITTGSFTGDAKREATRDGAPPIDLIDGDGLCELLKRYELGVKTTVRQVEEVAIHPEFFEDV